MNGRGAYRSMSYPKQESYDFSYWDSSLFKFVEVKDVNASTYYALFPIAPNKEAKFLAASIDEMCKTIRNEIMKEKVVAVMATSKTNHKKFRIFQIEGGHTNTVLIREYDPDASELYIEWLRYHLGDRKDKDEFLEKLTSNPPQYKTIHGNFFHGMPIFEEFLKLKKVIREELRELIRLENKYLKYMPDFFLSEYTCRIKDNAEGSEIKKIINSLKAFPVERDDCLMALLEIVDSNFYKKGIFARLLSPIAGITHLETKEKELVERWNEYKQRII